MPSSVLESGYSGDVAIDRGDESIQRRLLCDLQCNQAFPELNLRFRLN